MSAPTDDAVGRVAKALHHASRVEGIPGTSVMHVALYDAGAELNFVDGADALVELPGVTGADLRAVLARVAECEADTRRLASPVVAAFIAPNTSLWQGALVNVCADGSWWARPASLGEDAPWERQAVPLDHAMRGGA